MDKVEAVVGEPAGDLDGVVDVDAVGGELVVAPDAELAGETLAVGGDVGGAGEDDGEAAGGAAHEPVVLVVADRAVGVALLVGERGEGEAVWGGGAAAEGDLRRTHGPGRPRISCSGSRFWATQRLVHVSQMFAVQRRGSRPSSMPGLLAAPVLGPVEKFPAETS